MMQQRQASGLNHKLLPDKCANTAFLNTLETKLGSPSRKSSLRNADAASSVLHAKNCKKSSLRECDAANIVVANDKDFLVYVQDNMMQFLKYAHSLPLTLAAARTSSSLGTPLALRITVAYQ
jgi:hypothetical protein